MDKSIKQYISASPKSNQTYESHLRNFDSWVNSNVEGDVTDVSLLDLQRYFKQQQETYADKTIQTRYWAISSLYGFLVGHGSINEDPTEEFSVHDYAGTQAERDAQHESEENHIYLTRDEVEKLAENAPTDHPLRNELIIRLLFETGLRAGELSRIKLENINRENGDITVESSKKRKKTEHRTVHWWSDATETLMTQWLDYGYRAGIFHANSSPYLFPSQERDRIREQEINKVVKQAAENAGLQEEQYTDAAGRSQWKITAHTLRHSCAMFILENGGSVADVKKLLGHSDIQITQQYTDPSVDATRELVRRIGRSGE